MSHNQDNSKNPKTQKQQKGYSHEGALLERIERSTIRTQLNQLANTNSPLLPDSKVDAHLVMERDVINERLRQARLSFNLTLKLTVVSAFISLVGVGLLFSGKISEGAVTTAGGLTSNIVSIHLLNLTKEVNDRLDQMAKDLKDED
ncbi:MAG TPA: hypothetical protein V6C85_12890 [Allocoleopsis sp.]